jgi:hypothetical protein
MKRLTIALAAIVLILAITDTALARCGPRGCARGQTRERRVVRDRKVQRWTPREHRQKPIFHRRGRCR